MSFNQKDWLKNALDLYEKAKDTGLINNWGTDDLNSLREMADKFNNLTGMSPVQPDKGEQIQKEAVSKEEETESESFWKQESVSPHSGAFASGATKNSFTPPISIYETVKEVSIQAILPGIVSKDDLNILLSQEAMELSGARTAVRFLESKKTNDNFYRIVRLPAPVEPSGATASYRNGFLYIRVPKKNYPSPIKIMVKFE
ncbi:Hsp20/alpha crystallin family protein [Pelotomaculum sp. PtaB.Bin117]|uniref:Hsp20/alpha crystallin family protein n=1 Tax=Pelotomaculum sp. PtaB.Bin117 TaxID=1811694 RepID=UPI0009CBBDBD|nr:Hsp20/alpha crystallin family protein [Pelotomaculum sp. PtaB.Bin117]OPX87042.1 MAG: Hsp20/alpha crystallin family protein [Pelotomaculum sp. PtaB.Bin117]